MPKLRIYHEISQAICHHYQWTHSRYMTITHHAQYLWKGMNAQ
jgi:hypothetical protein